MCACTHVEGTIVCAGVSGVLEELVYKYQVYIDVKAAPLLIWQRTKVMGKRVW